MKTSELIIKLVNSLKKYGDLPITMVENKKLDIGLYCYSEGGKPEEIVFDSAENIELTDCDKDQEINKIEKIDQNHMRYNYTKELKDGGNMQILRLKINEIIDYINKGDSNE